MSDTPRTEEIAEQVDKGRGGIWPGRAIYMYDGLARTLERELTAEKQRSERLEKALNSARDHLLSPGARPETVAKEMVAARKIIDAALKEQSRE